VSERTDEWFLGSIIERRRLNHPLSQKKTYHIAIDLTGSNINYEVGDCLKILPHNSPETVDAILRLLGLSGAEVLFNGEDNETTVENFLTKKANLHKVTKKAFTAIVHASDCLEQQHSLLRIENKDALKDYLESVDILTLLIEYRPILTADQLPSLLLPLMPRYYSIASSMHHVNNQAHLTVAAVGVASDYLCEHAELFTPTIKLAHHKSPHFGLPKESYQKPIVMIGPGTGIAPFRGFLQERVALQASPENWLFFGERSSSQDFYYQDYLEDLKSKGFLRLETAFSRDTAHKIYVQDKMYENKKELWHWLHEKGAYLFICGDKNSMAKAVEETLQRIVSEEAGLALGEAKHYLNTLREDKRILRDVY
jgi:sulfite reductase (NADPH) flavoprotein alpha-component